MPHLVKDDEEGEAKDELGYLNECVHDYGRAGFCRCAKVIKRERELVPGPLQNLGLPCRFLYNREALVLG